MTRKIRPSSTHALVDVDLEELAKEQPPIANEPSSSLDLRLVEFPGIRRDLVCDTSQSAGRVCSFRRLVNTQSFTQCIDWHIHRERLP